MSYTFNGLLTGRKEAAAWLVGRCADCEVKQAPDQFDGFVVRFPCEADLHPKQGEEDHARLLEQLEQLKAALPQLSAQFPEDLIVYIEVECFGGVCLHGGAHFLGGVEIATFEATDLAEIVRPLDVSLGSDQYFRPFTRGYFERDALKNWNRPWPPP